MVVDAGYEDEDAGEMAIHYLARGERFGEGRRFTLLAPPQELGSSRTQDLMT